VPADIERSSLIGPLAGYSRLDESVDESLPAAKVYVFDVGCGSCANPEQARGSCNDCGVRGHANLISRPHILVSGNGITFNNYLFGAGLTPSPLPRPYTHATAFLGMNSTPGFSSVSRTAAIVRGFTSGPRSSLVIMSVATCAARQFIHSRPKRRAPSCTG
jgi:hypothetical protein